MHIIITFPLLTSQSTAHSFWYWYDICNVLHVCVYSVQWNLSIADNPCGEQTTYCKSLLFSSGCTQDMP